MFVYALHEHGEKCERISQLKTLVTLECKVREKDCWLFLYILLGCLASEFEWKKSNEASPMGEERDTIDKRYPGRASQLLIIFYVLTVQCSHG